jgi:hypothetical protein
MASASDRSRPFAPVRSTPCFAGPTCAYPNAGAPSERSTLPFLPRLPRDPTRFQLMWVPTARRSKGRAGARPLEFRLRVSATGRGLRAARESGRVVVDVVGTRVRTEVRAGRARVWCCDATLLDVTGVRRWSGRYEQRHDDRAGDSGRCLVDVAGDERLVVFAQNVGLELDRAVVADLDLSVALCSGSRAGRLVLGRQLFGARLSRAKFSERFIWSLQVEKGLRALPTPSPLQPAQGRQLLDYGHAPP